MAKKKNTPVPEENTVSEKKKKKTVQDEIASKPEIYDHNTEAEASESDFSLFRHVPDSGEIDFSTSYEDLNEAELSKIEEDAIAALPRAEVEPELLMYDPDEIEDTHESPEESARYEDFLKNYKQVMEQMLLAAKGSSAKKSFTDLFSEEGDISELVVTEDGDDELEAEDELITLSELRGRKKRREKSNKDDTEGSVENIEYSFEDTDGSHVDTEYADEENTATKESKAICEDADEVEIIDGEAVFAGCEDEAISEEGPTAAENEKDIPEVSDATASREDGSDDDSAIENNQPADSVEDTDVEENVENTDFEAIDGEADENVTEVNEADEDFDPLSTISLREYVPYLRGESEDSDEEHTEDEESEGEESEKYYEPEQLEIDFGDEDGEEEDGITDEESLEDEEYTKEKPRLIDTVFDLIEMFIFTFVAVMLITTFFIRHSIVDGSSMETTLNDRDVVIISDLFYEPRRGDIVVFEDRDFSDKVLIKRVIAVAGDRVTVMPSGDVYVNGRLLEEDYVYESYGKQYNHIDNLLVGEGEIFVLGDHRNVSLDSEDYGRTVSVDSILGKVLFRLFPLDGFGAVD